MSVPAVFWRINAAAATDRVHSAREFLTLCPNASVADEINLVEKSATASCRTRRPEGALCSKYRQALLRIAIRNVSLTRSCQPGPSCWKYARTSLSILSETSSLVLGNAGRSSAGAATFFPGLNNASAASIGLRGLRGGFAISLTFHSQEQR